MNKILLLIGKIDLAKEFYKLFSSDGKFLITPSLKGNHYFEMGGESAYYALQELEKQEHVSLKANKERIIQAIKDRLEEGEGKLLHKSFVGEKDTQFRSTNSAIRLLIAASHEGYAVDKEIKLIADYQFEHYFNWKKGIWFCHDSSELNGKTPWSHVRSKAAGKNWRNTLTLNTHLDSLNTLMLLRLAGMQNLVNFNLEEYLNKGLIAINQLLAIRSGKFSLWLQQRDEYFLRSYVHKVCKNKQYKENVIYEKIIHPLCFKILFPTVFFKNGFIARDLAVLNRHLDYLLVNVTDFARVISLYQRLKAKSIIDKDVLNYKFLQDKLVKAIELIENEKGLQQIIAQDDLQTAWLAEMYYTMAHINPLYREKVLQLNQQNLFCSVSPFFDAVDE